MKKNLLLAGILLSVCVYSAKAQATLNLKFFIQGFYTAANANRIADTAVIELRDPANTNTVVQSFKGLFQVNGTMACTFSNAAIGNSYYVVIKHRNSLETWSAAPIAM